MRFCLAFLFLAVLGLSPARGDTTDTAFAAAIDQFEAALPRLPPEIFGVDVAAYRDALTLRRFSSAYWGGTVSLSVEAGTEADASCSRFAAFVRLPPSAGAVTLVLCPQFSSPGADALRRLTVLHEMVHVVAGPDECRAMAFAALIEQTATSQFTDVTRYWEANGCEETRYALP